MMGADTTRNTQSSLHIYIYIYIYIYKLYVVASCWIIIDTLRDARTIEHEIYLLYYLKE